MPEGESRYLTISTSMSGFAALGFLLFAVFAAFLCPSSPVRTSCGGVPVIIPEAKQSSVVLNDGERLQVSLLANGNMYLGSRWVPADTLLGKMREQRRDTPILLSADRNADFGSVKRVLQMARTAGLRKIYLMTSPPHYGLLVHSLYGQDGRGWNLDEK